MKKIVVPRSGLQKQWSVFLRIQNQSGCNRGILRNTQESPIKGYFSSKTLLKYNSLIFKGYHLELIRIRLNLGFLTTLKILRSSLLPLSKESHKSLLVYFMDGNQATKMFMVDWNQIQSWKFRKSNIIMELQEMFEIHQKYTSVFKQLQFIGH